jgi:hypothetical protein
VEYEKLRHSVKYWGHGNLTNGLKKLETVAENYSIDSIQETAVLGTSHIVRKMIQSET